MTRCGSRHADRRRMHSRLSADAIRRAASALMAFQVVPAALNWWGQGGDRGVNALQTICSPCIGPGSQVCPASYQFMFFGGFGLGQSVSGHRQTCLAHSSPGQPIQGMSWSRSWRRLCPTTTTPQSGQPVTIKAVSACRTRLVLDVVTEWP